jgi:hypothetical protein
MIVYVASPYAGPNRRKVQENIEAANEYGKQVYLLGHVPIVPHRISALWDYDSRLKHVKPEEWLTTFCLPLLAVCGVLCLCGEWRKSAGCNMEFQEALRIGKIIFVDGIEGLKKW